MKRCAEKLKSFFATFFQSVVRPSSPASLSLSVFFLFSSMAFISCTGFSKPPATENFFRVFPEEYRIKAAELEALGNLQKALFCWNIVASFDPGDQEASSAVRRLKDRIEREAENHLQRGIQHFSRGQFASARKEFLLAIALNPEDKKAFDFLKHQLVTVDQVVYVTKDGDSTKKIAENVYMDNRFEYLVAYFTGFDTKNTVEAGVTINLPILEKLPAVKYPYPDKTKEKAESLYHSKKYREAITAAECILSQDPTDREAQRIMDDSCYQVGVDLFRKKRFEEAKDVFEDIGEDYKNVRQMLAYIRKHSESMAEVHYQKGVALFLSNKLEGAVKEWEETLKLNPDHQNAKKDLDKTRKLLDNLKQVE